MTTPTKEQIESVRELHEKLYSMAIAAGAPREKVQGFKRSMDMLADDDMAAAVTSFLLNRKIPKGFNPIGAEAKIISAMTKEG